MCVSDPIAASTRYARYTGRAVTKVADHFTVPLDRGVMVFVDPTDAARMLPNFAAPGLPYMAAASISSSDLSQTRDVLDQNGILPVAAAARSLWVGPEYALGSYLQFHSTAFSEVLQGGANAPSS
jgi:hypothetical protein